MNWETVCAGLVRLSAVGLLVEVNGVEYDSRRVGRGDVFVAMRGEATDGNRYIEAAVAQGAAAVVTDSREAYAKLRREHAAVAAALVERGRRALAEVSCSGVGASGAQAGSECGDGDEREDDDCVFAGGDAAQCGADVCADWDD